MIEQRSVLNSDPWQACGNVCSAVKCLILSVGCRGVGSSKWVDLLIKPFIKTFGLTKCPCCLNKHIVDDGVCISEDSTAVLNTVLKTLVYFPGSSISNAECQMIMLVSCPFLASEPQSGHLT